MGGRIALRAAALTPGIFSGLVLVDPPTSDPGRRPYPVPKARTLELLRAAHRGEAPEAIRHGSAAPWPEDLRQLRAEWLPTCDERAVHGAYDDFHAQDIFADLARIEAPLGLLCAGEGGVVSDADVAEMKQLHGDLHATRLPGVGHQMQAENFPAFKQALARHASPHRSSAWMAPAPDILRRRGGARPASSDHRGEPQLKLDAEVLELFTKEMALCGVKTGETIVVLTAGDEWQENAHAFMAAAQSLGAQVSQPERAPRSAECRGRARPPSAGGQRAGHADAEVG